MALFRRDKTKTKLCIECMQVNPADATTCDMCGSPLTTAPATAEQREAQTTAR